jgi:carbon-monoxide dehydrogenase small subunit
MIITATEILKKNPRASEQDVRHSLEGNICRCTGYENIVKSIVAAQGVKPPRTSSKPKSKKGAR